MPKIDIFKTPNPDKQDLLKKLWSTKRRVWRTVAKTLSKRRKDHIIVNLGRINRLVKPNETIVVPGKVLATGDLNKKIVLAAYAFSNDCEEKVKKVKGECITIQKLMERNPEGKNVKIIV
ncbi:MAG: 50S ribosomal protein L18e [Candidatus Helarchaeota archaeon]|nr:50S ribosomal protein L18e [Candidatus Helarchaeota archaeon]